MSRPFRSAWPLFFGVFLAAVLGGRPTVSGPVDLRVASFEAAGASAAAPASQLRTPVSDRGSDDRTPNVTAGAPSRAAVSVLGRAMRSARPGRTEPHRATFLRARFTTGPPAHP